MSEFQTASAALCTVGLACALLHTLVPEGGTKRVFSVLTGVFFFVCLMVPLTALFRAAGGFLVQSQTQVEVSPRLSEQVEKQVQDVLETSLLSDANERVMPYGVTVTAVYVQRDTSREDSIYIKKVRVVFSKKDFPVSEQIDTLLEQAWGTVVEVYYGE